MSEVRVRENESLESALKRFKRSCAKSGVLAEVRKREHYESPSVKRRKKSEAARKNRKSIINSLKTLSGCARTGFFMAYAPGKTCVGSRQPAYAQASWRTSWAGIPRSLDRAGKTGRCPVPGPMSVFSPDFPRRQRG